MRDVLNAVIVAALALVLMRGVGGSLGETGGAAVREKFLADYREELKTEATVFAVRLRSEEFKDSLSAVKAWSVASGEARVKASKPVDQRVKELCEAGDIEAAAVFAEEFAR